MFFLYFKASEFMSIIHLDIESDERFSLHTKNTGDVQLLSGLVGKTVAQSQCNEESDSYSF